MVAEPAGPLEESSRPPESAPEESSAGEPSSSSAPPSGREVIGEFAVLRDSDLINELADEHLELIYHYFDRSYRSLSTLKAEDLLDLFSPRTDEEYENSILNQLSLANALRRPRSAGERPASRPLPVRYQDHRI